MIAGFFFCLFSVIIGVITATRIYYIASYPERLCGSAYITGQIILTYKHGCPPITEFEEDRSCRWKGPPLEIVLEPDDQPGVFHLLSMTGRHIPAGLEIKNEFFEVYVKKNARINIKVVRNQVQSMTLNFS